jgi:hypothetical protein
MRVLERLRQAARTCGHGFIVRDTRAQALLTEVALRGSYTVTNDGIAAFSPFTARDVEEAQRIAAPHLDYAQFLQELHLHATTLVGEGHAEGRSYLLYLGEHSWRVRQLDGSDVVATREMADDDFLIWLARARAANAA